ncbi:hypothetical protein ONE63_002015 [Megalurothrips usitatus]|uniref:Uncharacterized protein n=1 Tax=Megalurothrips usitatus TaxID=439358 RepID=A0AAV7XEI7_9NEOP|nr:hypothetical protein ONE63_002015 [Megalurothrips usitatus]
MGLLLSVLVVCVGVFEALDCYYHFRAGLLPPARVGGGSGGGGGGEAAGTGWRHHLASLNERWRRRPSAALTCGDGGGGGGGSSGGSGGGGPVPASSEGALGKNAVLQEGGGAPTPAGHCQPNGHGAPRWLNGHAEQPPLGGGGGREARLEDPRTQESPPELKIEAAAEPADSAAPRRPPAPGGDGGGPGLRRPSSSLERPVAVDVLLADNLAEDKPRRLSENFPEVDDAPPPPQAALSVDQDQPRRLSEIDADVPSPQVDPRPSDADVPSASSPESTAAERRSRNVFSPQNVAEDRPRRVSESYSSYSDSSEPSSPTRRARVDISWPTFVPVLPAHKSSLSRLEDVLSVDVEDDVFQPESAPSPRVVPEHRLQRPPKKKKRASQPLVVDEPRLQETPSEPSKQSPGQCSSEYQQLTEFLQFLDKHPNEDDCMSLWHSTRAPANKGDPSDGASERVVENPSKQYLELQDFLKRHGGVADADAGRSRAETPRDADSAALVESEAAERQKLVAPEFSCDSSGARYMDLLNFWFLLRAQEESPGEPLLEEYFKKKADDEFRAPEEAPPLEPSDKFRDYNELVRFLQTVPAGEAEAPARTVPAVLVAAAAVAGAAAGLSPIPKTDELLAHSKTPAVAAAAAGRDGDGGAAAPAARQVALVRGGAAHRPHREHHQGRARGVRQPRRRGRRRGGGVHHGVGPRGGRRRSASGGAARPRAAPAEVCPPGGGDGGHVGAVAAPGRLRAGAAQRHRPSTNCLAGVAIRHAT